jgi:xanthine/CO dehydrogenase XdhC/CoxF family maturation factor
MLIVPDGRRIGSISGGCLEGEIARKAWWFTESGTPVVRVYDTTSDDDAVWEFGLGCNGVVQVMLERVDTPGASALLEFLDAQRASPAVIATVIRGEDVAGDRLLIDAAGHTAGSLAGSNLELALRSHTAAAMRERRSRLVHLGETQVFVEWIGPPLSLVVFGAGHDAVPLSAIARELGWSVTVADGRPAYARANRFPDARVVLTTLSDPLRDVRIDHDTAVVLMTHNYPLDVRLLPRILPLRPRYLGLLGPRRRAEKLFAEIGIDPPAGVHYPIGLDLGGDAPTSIAVAIAAEIQAALHGRRGGMLQYRTGAIHAPAEEFGASPLEFPEGVRPAYCETMLDHHA